MGLAATPGLVLLFQADVGGTCGGGGGAAADEDGGAGEDREEEGTDWRPLCEVKPSVITAVVLTADVERDEEEGTVLDRAGNSDIFGSSAAALAAEAAQAVEPGIDELLVTGW